MLSNIYHFLIKVGICTFRESFPIGLVQYIVTRAGQSIAPNPAIVIIFIISLAETGKTDNQVAGSNEIVGDQFVFWPAGSHSTVHRYRANKFLLNGTLSPEIMDINSKLF